MGVPSSTYRLQITPSFDLSAAAELVGYLDTLGAGAVYCSPLLQSASGSSHGYDVVDPTRIDLARGGASGWRALVESARSAGHGQGLVVDIVPNHLGVADASENPAWWDVLRRGPASPYAAWFDIERGSRRLLIPVLGDNFDADRDLSIVDGELRYHDHRFPIAPGTQGGSPAEVHDRQHYELVDHRRASVELTHRRFFAITTLAGVRVEDPEVFEATHRQILRWTSAGEVDGLRIDHPDGLADPRGYLARLRSRAPDAWITVEKVLQPGEQLPAWPVSGTTGYDALAEVSAVLVDPAAAPAFDAIYREIASDERTFAQHAEAGKRLVAMTILRPEIKRLARLVPWVGNAAAALTELLVAFPVYRSYLPDGAEHLAAAIGLARARAPELAGAIASLVARLSDPADELCVRFQQTSAAVMAKGVEDTAYYRYGRFIALNEVGGDPARFGSGLAEFHAAQEIRVVSSPDGMTTLSTHDTKRGEDVRARLLAVAEFPDEWLRLVRRLMARVPVPHRAFGYLLWQTFVGVGFVARERMHGYAEKAMREANDGTSWTDPNPAFEQEAHAAVDTAYDEPEIRALIGEFVALVTPPAWSNSLAQKLIQLTMPGVPDVYQGTELWDDSLVDPDNRRPVDFARRASVLAALDGAGSPPPVDATGAAKLWLVSRALRLRRDRPELFTGYAPLRASGPAADHVVAFDRGGALTVATRLPARLPRAGGWRDTTLTLNGEHTDVLTGRHVSGPVEMGKLFATYPVALLART